MCDKGKEYDAITRLARVGYDNTIGYLAGGLETWIKAGKETDSVDFINAKALETIYSNSKPVILDVRRTEEYEAEHVENANNKPLDLINDWVANLSKEETYYIHCAGGYRSVITISILKARGFHHLINIQEGFKGIAATNIKLRTTTK